MSRYTLGVFCARVCLRVFIVHVPVLTGRGGGAEQKEHEEQADAKADPTQRGGDCHRHHMCSDTSATPRGCFRSDKASLDVLII